MIWLIVYIVGYVASVILLAISEARENGVFTLADLGEGVTWSLLWPLLVIVVPCVFFPVLNKEPSDIVLWRRKGGSS